jgi:hypothetical protein
MTPRPSLKPAVVKELRASWPVLAAALTAMLASPVLAGGYYRGAGILAYTVGAASLGAIAFGHEFSSGTMQSLLALPRSRHSTMSIKVAVLLVSLLLLALAGHLVTFRALGAESADESTFLFWLPLATAVGLAPWLTLSFRSATAGMAFSLATPGFMFCGALLAWAATRGFTPVPQSFVFRVGWVGTLLVSSAGVFLGWRAFQRLEAIDGGSELGWWRWRRADTATRLPLNARRFHPLWLLVRKELELQRMTFIVAGAYLVGVMILILARPVADEVAEGMTLLYVAFLPCMPGALASAEEHQLGTIEWQMTLPIASWKQWIVKVGVVLGVGGALALGLPGALGLLPDRVLLTRLGVAVLMLAAGSLYVSSTSHSSLWALLTAIFAMVVAACLAARVAWSLYPQGADMPAVGFRMFMSVVVAAGVLTLAKRNHQTVRAGGWPAGRHAAAAAACAVCTALALIVMV